MFESTKRWLWALNRRFETTRVVTCSGAVLVLLAIPLAAQTHFSPCDLNQDGAVNAADVQLAINMALGVTPCSAQIGGLGLCNVAVVQRVINATLGGACVTGAGAVPHNVVLNWFASSSANIAGYNVYRSSSPGGPYTRLNSSLIAGTTFTDSVVAAGDTYYYVSTAVDSSNNESAFSNEAAATAPSP